VTDPRIRRTARRIKAEEAHRKAAEPPPFFYADVASVALLQAGDGNSVVQVKWSNATVTANAYLAAYTPKVGDRVACLYDGSQVLVLGRSIGWQ
jgi:hypothetical protein